MLDFCSDDLKLYSSITETPVDWLWYPYIPFGKVTLLQGDPGCGKSTLMMNVISSMSVGSSSPDGRKFKKPMHVIYQCSEDGAGDTIKPRLTAAGADCRNIAFLDEETDWLTLSDDRIRRAIADFNAKLLVIDPVQAYLGDSDLSSVTGMRKVLRQLSSWAAMYECAIVLVGHLNKKQGSKDIYRSLGSIDLIASARSVLQIDPSDDAAGVMTVRHLKSSLAPRGPDLFFSIDPYRCVKWVDESSLCKPNDDAAIIQSTGKMSKLEQTMELLKVILSPGPAKASEISEIFSKENVSQKTLMNAKKLSGIQSIKKNGIWYWCLPSQAALFSSDSFAEMQGQLENANG